MSVSANREQWLTTLLRISQLVRYILPGIVHGVVATRVEHVQVSIQIVGNVIQRQQLEWKCRVNALAHVWRDAGTARKEATEEQGDLSEGDKGRWGGQKELRKWGGEKIPWACELVNVHWVGEVRSADTEGVKVQGP